MVLKAQFHLKVYKQPYRNNKEGGFHQAPTSYWNDRKGDTVHDKSGHCSKLLKDLSIASEHLSHDLVVARANTMVLRINFLNLVFKYLNNRKQRAKIDSKRSSF